MQQGKENKLKAYALKRKKENCLNLQMTLLFMHKTEKNLMTIYEEKKKTPKPPKKKKHQNLQRAVILDPKCEFSKVSRYKINTQKLITFLYENKEMETEI